MRKRLFTAVVLTLAATMPAAAAPDYAALQTTLYEKYIQPDYDNLAQKTHALEYKTVGHCKYVGETPDMLAVRTAFHDAMDAWQMAQHIRHGAVATDDRHARLQFWPDKRGITERHMRKLLAEPVTANFKDDLPRASVAIQGFPALERLLFSDLPLSQHVQPGEKAVRCTVAVAIAHNIASIAAALKQENATPPTDAKADIRDTVNDLVTGLEFVQSLKLKLPAGKARPRPHLLENWRSVRSLKNVEINIRALRDLYEVLAASIPDDNPQHSLIRNQFDAAEDAIRAMGENGKELLGEELGPVRFRALSGTLETIRDMIAETLPGHLGVDLGFNSLDGD